MKLDKFLERTGEKKRIAVVAAADKEVLLGLDEAMKRDLVEPMLIGDREEILIISRENQLMTAKCDIIHQPSIDGCAKTAVALARGNEVHALMKGNIHTSILMHAILNKENGIRENEILNSVNVVDSSNLDRLLFVSDPGIVPYPDMKQKVGIINNAVKVARALGVERPKVAVICAVESVNPIMPPTMEAAALALMSQRGQFKDCDVDGPLALDNAISVEAVNAKKVMTRSPVAGHADILLVPNVETGNAIMKTARFLGNCKTAGILAGASVPVIMTSRADSAMGKLYSIGMALAASQ